MSFLSENFLGLLLGSVAVLLYILVRKRLNFFSDRGLPHLAPTWWDLPKIFSINFFSDLPDELYQRTRAMDSPYIGTFGQFLQPVLLVRDPAMVSSVLIKDFTHFEDHGFDIDFKQNPLAGHLFNMRGNDWRTLRHKLVPTFTSGKLRGMVPIIEECADKLIEEMNQDPSLTRDTNLKELFKRFSLSVIASCAFGIDPESIRDPESQFKKVLNRVAAPNLLDRLKLSLSFLFPKTMTRLNIKMMDQELEEFIYSLTRDTMEMRRRSGEKRNDFIQLLLELKEKGSVELDSRDLEQDETEALASLEGRQPPAHHKLEFTDGLLAAQVFVFLIAGFENVAYIIAMTLYLISKDPRIQARAREEAVRCRDRHGSLSYDALRDMKFLGACVDEALRMYPPLPIIFRVCNKPYTFADGGKIDKGTPVFMPARSFQMDSKYWEDPDDFKPDRWLDGEASPFPGTYLPFGDGPRLCIAQRLALQESKLVLAKVLMKYSVEPSKKTKEPLKLKVVFGADNDGGLWGSFSPLPGSTD